MANHLKLLLAELKLFCVLLHSLKRIRPKAFWLPTGHKTRWRSRRAGGETN